MGYKVWQHGDQYEARKGLEGPFRYPNGQVLYYDPRAGEYWDPRTDFYVSNDDVARLQQSVFDQIKG